MDIWKPESSPFLFFGGPLGVCMGPEKRRPACESPNFFPENEKSGPESERFRNTVWNLKNIVKLSHFNSFSIFSIFSIFLF